MKASLFNSHFFRTLSVFLVVLTIVTSGNRNNFFGGQNSYVTAFCIKSNYINAGVSRSALTISAGRSSSINEWVSYLEEEFNRKDDVGNNNFNGDEDIFRPTPQQRSFQTPVTTHTNVMDFLDQIDNATMNDLTVVLFFAHYCKTCQRAIVPFKQLANDSAHGVHFVRFETSALSPNQFLSLGLDRIPFLQIYRNGICVSSFSATQKISRTSRKMVLRPRLLQHIDDCQRRSFTDWSAFWNRHQMEIEANKVARAKIREAVRFGNSGARNGITYDNDDERLYRSVQTLTSESDLLDLLYRNQDVVKERAGGDYREEGNDTVVIMFHSHFDQSCRRAQHKFRKISVERQQQQTERDRSTCSYTMARIEASILPDNTLQLLGIQRYPHIQIYRNSNRPHKNKGNAEAKECVASFSIPRSFLFARMLHESLDTIEKRTIEDWSEFYNQHREDIEFQQLALEGIVQEREKQEL